MLSIVRVVKWYLLEMGRYRALERSCVREAELRFYGPTRRDVRLDMQVSPGREVLHDGGRARPGDVETAVRDRQPL